MAIRHALLKQRSTLATVIAMTGIASLLLWGQGDGFLSQRIAFGYFGYALFASMFLFGWDNVSTRSVNWYRRTYHLGRHPKMFVLLFVFKVAMPVITGLAIGIYCSFFFGS